MSARLSRRLLIAAGVVVLAPMTVPGSVTAPDRGVGRHLVFRHALAGEVSPGGERSGDEGAGPAQEAYDDRAYPHKVIGIHQAVAGLRAYRELTAQSATAPTSARAEGAAQTRPPWRQIGPTTAVVPAVLTQGGRETSVSGRVTALAIGSVCVPGNCRMWVGAAGGGVWRTADALAPNPEWTDVSHGLTSNAIGSIAIDPTDPAGNTLYVGTGEANSSSDSEAGVGLFRSTDGGDHWRLLPGSVPVSRDRSIGAIAIDPTDPQHIFIGTDLARHGMASVWGGRRTPAGAPPLGLYESMDRGHSFSEAFSLPGSTVPPTTGNDWFQGGVNEIAFDPSDPTTVYVAVRAYGIWRRSPNLDGDSEFHQVFQTVNPSDERGDRTEFSVTTKQGHTRIYAGDGSSDLSLSMLWRTDDADVPASTLFDGTDNTGWVQLSDPTNGTPGYTSFNFCQGQCDYDQFVASPPGQPDTVWIGGSFAYDEVPYPYGGSPARSNGRAVMRSTNAGVSFTDMTADDRDPFSAMHPDQHAIAFSPNDPGVAFIGSDGGVVRTSGDFVDASAQCDGRALTGPDLNDCRTMLAAIPSRVESLNGDLPTLQFQSLSVNPANPAGDLLGGTQDNGTLSFGGSSTWFETIFGDGGQSGTDAKNPNRRVHTYFDAAVDVNFHRTEPTGWDWVGDPLFISRENMSFYVPLITDPVVGGSIFIGLQHVWRTTDFGGKRAILDAHCNEFAGDFSVQCGDWERLGADLTSTDFGRNRAGEFVVAIQRSRSDRRTMWAATRTGRVFITKNANAEDPRTVRWVRLDAGKGPGRFVSGIEVDPAHPNHAWVAYSGYGAYTPGHTGHVFSVTFHPAAHGATWRNLSHNLGDQPVTDVARDDATGDLYVSTDWSVYRLAPGAGGWVAAGQGLPLGAVYGLTISSPARVLYAATHGRGAWKLRLP